MGLSHEDERWTAVKLPECGRGAALTALTRATDDAIPATSRGQRKSAVCRSLWLAGGELPSEDSPGVS